MQGGWTSGIRGGGACIACLLIGMLVAGGVVRGDEPASIDAQSTHADSGKILVPGIKAFSIDREGRILAACQNADTGTIKILDSEGELLKEWQVDFKPEAINVTPEGEILVGGVGQLRRFDHQGQLLQQGESPHISVLQQKKKELREEVVAQLSQQLLGFDASAMLEQYSKMLDGLKEKEKQASLTSQETQILKILPQYIERLEAQVKAEQEQSKDKEKSKEPTEEQIQETLKSTMAYKSRVASISTDGRQIYVATPSAVGYGYSVWRLNQDFTGGEELVSGLRGCCGQMDVQCHANGIYVAENARHRVVCFDAEGKERVSWGKTDRTGLDGFTSCCNPMNVCFNSQGDVYTAESSTGRIKRFDKDGKFLDYVGDVKLVPGCKNVSIAVSPDSTRVYMLDITRSHIVIMRELDEATRETRAKQAEAAQERQGKQGSTSVLDVFRGILSAAGVSD